MFRAGPSAAFGCIRDGYAWLAFRGTRLWPPSAAIPDVLTDLAIIPWGRPYLHLGFLCAWRRLAPQILGWLATLPPESRKVILTGHSLGGAIALIGAFHISQVCPVRAVVTFGAPRVGSHSFMEAYERQGSAPAMPGLIVEPLAQVTLRYTHETDLISRISPPGLFWHVGEEHTVDREGKIKTARPPGWAERFDNRLTGWGYKFFGPTYGLTKDWQAFYVRQHAYHRQAQLIAAESERLQPGSGPAAAKTYLERFAPLPPEPPPSPTALHVKRTKVAWASLWSRFHSFIWMIAGLPMMVLGMLFGLIVIAILLIDGSKHECRKYIDAFGKRPSLDPGSAA